MVNMIFGREYAPDNFILDPRPWFTAMKKPEWFEDDFIKRLLKEVDGTTVLFEEALKDCFGRGISTEMISTGCKNICTIYFDNGDHTYFGTGMGDNCVPFIAEIGRQRDLNVVYEHYVKVPQNILDEGIFRFGGKPVTKQDIESLYSLLCATLDKEAELEEYGENADVSDHDDDEEYFGFSLSAWRP